MFIVTPLRPGPLPTNPPGRTVLVAPPKTVLSLWFLNTMNMIAATRINMTVERAPITRPIYCFGSDESLKLDKGGTEIIKINIIRSYRFTNWVTSNRTINFILEPTGKFQWLLSGL